MLSTLLIAAIAPNLRSHCMYSAHCGWHMFCAATFWHCLMATIGAERVLQRWYDDVGKDENAVLLGVQMGCRHV